jgi:hypothetical protein
MKNFVAMSALAIAASAALTVGSANAASFAYTDGATDFNGEYRTAGTTDPFSSFSGSWLSGPGAVAISFDLFGARSVDGVNSYQDVFTVNVNGFDVFSGSFDMSGGGGNLILTDLISATVSTVTNPGGFFQGGVTSVSGLINLVAGLNTITVIFSQPGPDNGGGQGVGDESWALNDLAIASVPVPAALPLMLLGLAGLGAVGRRKRKVKTA